MARTKRIFREWQHPRASNGRFARKGSPEWVKAAAEKFRHAPEGLRAGTSAPGHPGRPRIARGAKAEAALAAHDASVTTRLAPHQPVQGPAARPASTTRGRIGADAKKVATSRDTRQTGGVNNPTTLSAEQRANYDKLLGNGPGEGLVKHKQSRQIVEQLEQHGWTLNGNAPKVGLLSFKAPDGREIGVQFLTGQHNAKPRFFTGSAARGRDLSYKAALAHVVTPTHEEVGGGGVNSARERLGLPDVRDNYSDHTLKPFRDAIQAHTGYGTMHGPTKNTSEVAADLRKAAENNRRVADQRAEYNRGIHGASYAEDGSTTLLRQRADEFEAVAAEMEKMDRERAAYVAERDRRAGLPLDIRPTSRTGPARPAKKTAAPKAPSKAVANSTGSKTPDGVRPTDGRPDVAALLKMQGRNRDYDLGNSRGRDRSAAPDMVRAGNGYLDGQPASAEIKNPTDGTGDYRYRIYNDQTGATLEEGTGRDLADVKAKVDRMYSSQRGGGMARTAGNEVHYEARSVERKKDPSRGDFGKGPFYDHQVVEVRKDGTEHVKVKTNSADRAAAQAAEMNAKEGVTPPSALEQVSTNIAEQRGLSGGPALGPELAQSPGAASLASIKTATVGGTGGGARDYEKMDRATLNILARDARIPIAQRRGKSNAELAAMLHAKDEQTRADRSARQGDLNPGGLGESSTVHEQHHVQGVRQRNMQLDLDNLPGDRGTRKSSYTPWDREGQGGRITVSGDARTRAASPAGLYDRHKGLTREQFDALPETRQRTVLDELRQAVASKEQVPHTIASNRSGFHGATIRGTKDAPHVEGARNKLRELTYTAPPPIDNSIAGRAARLKAGDRYAADGTIDELNQIARAAGLAGFPASWKRQKGVDYLRNQVLAGDRLKAVRDGDLSGALRGATPAEAMAVMDVRDADGALTLSEINAAAKALGVKLPAGDKRKRMHALAAGAKDAPAGGGGGNSTMARLTDEQLVRGLEMRGTQTPQGKALQAEAERRGLLRPKADVAQEAAPRWIDKATGREVTNPGQVGIVRGDIVKADSDAGKAAVAAREARRDANRAPGRAARIEATLKALPADLVPDEQTRKQYVTESNGTWHVGMEGHPYYLQDMKTKTAALQWIVNAQRSRERLRNDPIHRADSTPYGKYGSLSRADFDKLPPARQREIAAELHAARMAQRNGGEDGGASLLIGKFGLSPTAAQRQAGDVTAHPSAIEAAAGRKPGAANLDKARAATRGRFARDLKAGKLDTPRDKSQTGGAGKSPTTEANVTTSTRKPGYYIDGGRNDPPIRLTRVNEDGTSKTVATGSARDMTNLLKKHQDAAAKESAGKATPGEPQLGVTESSRGRTTTVTLPDGTTVQRTSKTMAYTHAVVTTTDQRGEARDMRATAERSDRYAAALQQWLDSGADISKLEKHRTATQSMKDREDGRSPYAYYLPGFGPVQHTMKRSRHGGGGTYLSDDHQFGIPDPADKTPLGYVGTRTGRRDATSYEEWGPGYLLEHHRKNAARNRAAADKLDAGPAETYGVYRWSQSLNGAMAGANEAGQVRNRRTQVIGVGGVAKAPTKPARVLPTVEELEAAKLAKKATEQEKSAARRQAFFDEKINGIAEALNGGAHADNPEWHIDMTTEAGLVSLAKHLKVKVANRRQSEYGPRPRNQEEIAKIRQDIVKAVRERLGKA